MRISGRRFLATMPQLLKSNAVSRVSLTVVLALCVFVVSFFLPQGVSYGLLYVAVLLFAIQVHTRSFIWRVACLVALLLALDHLFRPQSREGDRVVEFFNLTLAFFAIWTTAFLGSRGRAKREEIMAANQSLDE